jgi:hypothetical protein
MRRRWFGPQSGDGRGRLAWLLGATPVSAQGWIATGLFIAAIAVTFALPLPGLAAWPLRIAAFAAFLTVIARTFGPDPT